MGKRVGKRGGRVFVKAGRVKVSRAMAWDVELAPKKKRGRRR